MIDLENLQQAVGHWAWRNFGDNHGLEHIAPLLGVQEELGELTHEVLKEAQAIRLTNQEKEKDAVGDIVIYLLDYCHRRGLKFEQCIRMAWDEVKDRDWKKFPKNGKTE